MFPTVLDILSRIDHYSRAERAQLAEAFLHSLDDGEEDEGCEQAWNEEIERRVDRILDGQTTGKPAEQVFAEMQRSRLNR